MSKGGWMHLIPSAIALTPSLHLTRSVASSTLNSIFFKLSSTCLFQVCFGRPDFRCPFTLLMLVAFFKMFSSSLLTSCPYYLTSFAYAILSKVSFKPSIFIRSSVFFLASKSLLNFYSKLYFYGTHNMRQK